MTDREVIRRHSKSFSLAASILPPAARGRAEALYAWCRSADDSIDHSASRAEAEDCLDQLRADVASVYEGRPSTTAPADALRRVVASCGITREYHLELLGGLEMDVRAVRYETADELLLYCHRVAGVVGLMMCHALGLTNDAGLPHAAHLGIGMQLTNIARDVAEDWHRGRMYLPSEWLPRRATTQAPLSDEELSPAVRRCLQLADRYYRSGEAGLRYLSPWCRLAVGTASQVYRAIGDEVAAKGHRPSAGRAVVPAWRKMALLTSTALGSLPELLTGRDLTRAPSSLLAVCPLLKPVSSIDPNPEIIYESSSVLA